MTNTFTSLAMVNDRIQADFASENVIGAITQAYLFCEGKKPGITYTGVIDDVNDPPVFTNENEASVIADFAALILMNSRNISKSKQSDLEFKTLVQLWAENSLLESLLLEDQAQDPDRLFLVSAEPKVSDSTQWYTGV